MSFRENGGSGRGRENGGITAITGDDGYEPNGFIHDMTNFPEDTVLHFTNFGPIRYINDHNNTLGSWKAGHSNGSARRHGESHSIDIRVAYRSTYQKS